MVLFDLDGVITRRDTFLVFVRRTTMRRPWLLPALIPIAAAMALSSGTGRLRGLWARAGARVTLLGVRPEDAATELRLLGIELANSPGWINRDAISAIRTHRESGALVLVVTATEEGLATALMHALGLDVKVLGSRLTAAPGGSRLAPHNYGGEKVRRLKSLQIHSWSDLYTDSLADRPLMEDAQRIHLVNPRRTRRPRLAPLVRDRVEAKCWT